MLELSLKIRAKKPREKITSVCCFLGSFDPPHLGHLWISEYCAQRFDRVLLLVPVVHYIKKISYPQNARLDQRIEMLQSFHIRHPDIIETGKTNIVLFLELEPILQKLYPSAEISFAVGNDTFSKFLRSEWYFHHFGLEWTCDEKQCFNRINKRMLVFNRTKMMSNGINLPQDIRSISSTKIRYMIGRLHLRNECLEIWKNTLKNFLLPPVIEYIYFQQLYTTSPSNTSRHLNYRPASMRG